MKLATLILLTALAATAAGNGIPARPTPADYPTHAIGNDATVGADWLGADQVKSIFSTDLAEYIVVEVAVYPRNAKTLDVTSVDFALRVDGRIVRPVDPSSIANINQKRSNKRRDDIALYPTVGMSTGTWGTGVGVGVGVGRSGHPGPASSPRDRDLMQMELEENVLQDSSAAKPVAGYLFFPVGKKKATGYDLEYHGAGTDVKLRITSN